VRGVIVFGSLMGAMFIGQQFLQNVLGYSTLEPGSRSFRRRSAWCWSRRGRRRSSRSVGARFTLLFGYVFVLAGFLTMLLLWKEHIGYWKVGLGYALVGIGVGLAGTPGLALAHRSVPVRRVGMASGTADLQRDLGGAVMQSIFGALLTRGVRNAAAAAISGSGTNVTRASRTSSRSPSTERSRSRAVPAVRGPDHAPRPRPRSCKATMGVPGRIIAVLARRGARVPPLPGRGA
jgi:hypothetical protein